MVFFSLGYTITDNGGASAGHLAVSMILTDPDVTAVDPDPGVAIATRVLAPGTLVTSGGGKPELSHVDDLQDGLSLTVREGKTVETSKEVIPDGADLSVGIDVATAFAVPIVPSGGDESSAAGWNSLRMRMSKGIQASTRRFSLPAGGRSTTLLDSTRTGQSPRAWPPAPPREAAAQAEQVAGSRARQGGRASMQRRIAAGWRRSTPSPM